MSNEKMCIRMHNELTMSLTNGGGERLAHSRTTCEVAPASRSFVAMGLTLEDIRDAASRLHGPVPDTPCVPPRTVSTIAGCDVFLEFENLRFTASFKQRGSRNEVAQLGQDERARGGLAASAGNHAQGVAHHAQRLGTSATLVMPCFAPAVKVENTRRFGATVVLEGDTFDDARAHGLQLAQERSLTLVQPYDDLAAAARQRTIGLGMLARQPDVDTSSVAIGGGALISGVATAARSIKRGLRVIGVQTEPLPAVWNAVHAEQRESARATIADGIGIGTGKLGANIDEMQHQRAFTSLPVERVPIEVAVRARGGAPIEKILTAMRAQGYSAERIG